MQNLYMQETKFCPTPELSTYNYKDTSDTSLVPNMSTSINYGIPGKGGGETEFCGGWTVRPSRIFPWNLGETASEEVRYVPSYCDKNLRKLQANKAKECN